MLLTRVCMYHIYVCMSSMYVHPSLAGLKQSLVYPWVHRASFSIQNEHLALRSPRLGCMYRGVLEVIERALTYVLECFLNAKKCGHHKGRKMCIGTLCIGRIK